MDVITSITAMHDVQWIEAAVFIAILIFFAALDSANRMIASSHAFGQTWPVPEKAASTSAVASFPDRLEGIREVKWKCGTPFENGDCFRAIADNCPAMLWATGAKGDVQFLSRAYRNFCGIGLEELRQAQWQFPIHPDDAPGYLAEFSRAIRERTSFRAEARFRQSDGQWRLVGSRAEPRFSSSSDYLGHVGLSADITERTKSEQMRQFELSLIRSIHEGSPDGILVVNGEGKIVSHNKRFLNIWRISGHSFEIAAGTPDEAILSKVLDRVHAPGPFLKRVRELYEDPNADDDCEITLKDGRTLERHSTSLRSERGEYLGRVWFFRDITARKLAEIRLQASIASGNEANRRLLSERSLFERDRKLLRDLIDNVPDFVYAKDLQSRFVVANRHVASVAGLRAPEELIGKSDFDVFPKEIASAFYEDEQNLIRSGRALNNREEKAIDASGNEIHILTTKVPLRNHKGQITGIAGIGHDISARKKMEDALREAELKYRGIFDKAIFGIFQSTPKGRFLTVNSAMAFIFGYDSPEEMIAALSDIYRQLFVDEKRRIEFMRAMVKMGDLRNFECEVFCKDKRKIWLSMSVRAIEQDGSVIRYEGMCDDITERKLLREQLVQAQKLESVGQLAAGMAHEINTPTQYIGDNVRFLKDAFQDLKTLLTTYERLVLSTEGNSLSRENLQEAKAAIESSDADYLMVEIPKAIEQALEGVARVATLVAAVKEFSHPGTKEKTRLDLNHTIEGTIEIARSEWKCVADVETDFDRSLPLISCLPSEFSQAILNLIINAAHSIADVSRNGGPEKGKIKIQTRKCPDWAEVRIEDSGTGIPAGIRDRVFDPFFTTKEIGKGTGQGLSIARSVIADKHGGSIHFETDEGKGTTFIIRVPYNETRGRGSRLAPAKHI